MSLTREDMLRELELLPAWSLRSPILDDAVTLKHTPALLEQTKIEPVVVESAVISEAVITEVAEKPQALQYMASEDGDWLFLLPRDAGTSEMSTDEAILLCNICNAMQIKMKPVKTASNITELLNGNQAKLLVAMGESTAQHLLNSAESLENMRGIVHAAHSAALVVTYDLKHLLQTLPDKAKAWDDLRLAMQTLQRLKSGNS